MEIQSIHHHIQKGVIMQLPGDFKRKYRYKSNPRKDRLNYIIAIIISIAAFLLIWFYL